MASDNLSYNSFGDEKAEQDVKSQSKSDTPTEPDSEPNQPQISYFQLFRYSTICERFFIFIAIICALASGAPIPLFILVLGDMLEVLLHYEASINGTYHSKNSSNLTTSEFMSKMSDFSLRITVYASAQIVLVFIMVLCMNYTAEKQIERIRNKFMKSIIKQEIGWFDKKKSGNFASSVGENLLKFQLGIGEKLPMTIFFISMFLISVTESLLIGWKLTLVILSIIPFLIFAFGALSYVQTKLAEKEMNAYKCAGSIAEEVLNSFKTVVAFGGEQKEIDRYNSSLEIARKSGIRRGLATSFSMGFSNFFIFIAYALGFWYGSKLIVDSRHDSSVGYTPGIVLKVFTNVLNGSMFLSQSASFFEVFSVARAAAYNIYEILEQKPEIDSSSDDGKVLEDLNGDITFADVHFSYPSRKDIPILKGLNLRVNKGETVALVGVSGCGKSTVTNLVQRFYDVDSGSVMIDGVNIKDVNVGWLRDNIGLVGQEPSLFGTTIRENIMFGKQVSENEMIQASKLANAHDFIIQLPSGYNTLVGGKGSQLSGGQKQRVAIARALVRDPKILLLDEATSALDSESESLVQEALDKASEGRTTIIIAHRLSTIRHADRILVINDGQVLEEGSHDELFEKKGQYYQHVSLQIDLNADDEDDTPKSPVFSNRALSRNDSVISSTASSGHQKFQFENDEEAEEMKHVLWKTLKLNSPEKWYIFVGIFMSILVGSSYTVYGYFYGEILGIYALKDTNELMKKAIIFAIVFLGIGISIGVTTVIQMFMFTFSGEKLTLRMRSLAFTSMIKQEVGWHDDKDNAVGALCNLLSSDAASVQGATGVRLGTVIQGLATLGSAFALSFYLNWKLTLVTATTLPFLIIASFLEVKLIHSQASVEKNALDEGNKIAVDALSNIRTVASLHIEKRICDKYAQCFVISTGKAVRNTFIRATIFAFSQAMFLFIYAAVFIYGAYLVSTKAIYYTDLFRISEVLVTGSFVTAQAFAFSPDYHKAIVSAARILKLIKRLPRIDAFQEAGSILNNYKGSVNFSHIQFNYASRPEHKVLRNINLTVEPGMTVALVGSSGCGKSTCIQLIERFYDSDFGDLFMGSTVNTELNLKWLRSQISLVQQEPVLFGYSIADNIAYGKCNGKATMDEIVKAAQDANIHSFISELPLGYDTLAGDKGSQLSGGQKQRIAIARALIRKPKLLLLDEATSALDRESEMVVEEALEKARHGRSCIVIAHRLSTIQNADCIIAMKNGRIEEIGTHKELLQLKGLYYLLHQKQTL